MQNIRRIDSYQYIEVSEYRNIETTQENEKISKVQQQQRQQQRLTVCEI